MGLGEEEMMRPVLRGLCKYESLIDGTLTYADVVLLNEAIDVDVENQFRYAEMLKEKS